MLSACKLIFGLLQGPSLNMRRFFKHFQPNLSGSRLIIELIIDEHAIKINVSELVRWFIMANTLR